jgi:hypothetical protein
MTIVLYILTGATLVVGGLMGLVGLVWCIRRWICEPLADFIYRMEWERPLASLASVGLRVFNGFLFGLLLIAVLLYIAGENFWEVWFPAPSTTPAIEP